MKEKCTLETLREIFRLYQLKAKQKKRKKEGGFMGISAFTNGTIKRIYEVSPGKLYAGGIPSSPQKKDIPDIISYLINDCGVKCIVNLMEADEVNSAGERFNPYEETAEILVKEIETVRFAIRDMAAPTKTLMKTTLDFIDQKISQGRSVYVHCWGGLGRTGCVVCCWLKRHGEANPIAKIHQLRKRTINANQESPQSKAQYELIRDWKTGE